MWGRAAVFTQIGRSDACGGADLGQPGVLDMHVCVALGSCGGSSPTKLELSSIKFSDYDFH
jgi:hypothetical protein